MKMFNMTLPFYIIFMVLCISALFINVFILTSLKSSMLSKRLSLIAMVITIIVIVFATVDQLTWTTR